MAEKHPKKFTTSLVIREMQIKTTLRFHFIPVRKAKIKKSGNNFKNRITQTKTESPRQKHRRTNRQFIN